MENFLRKLLIQIGLSIWAANSKFLRLQGSKADLGSWNVLPGNKCPFERLSEDREILLNFYIMFTVQIQIFTAYLLNITNRRKERYKKNLLWVVRLACY